MTVLYNKVEICGVNTANLKVLSENEKIRLLKRMHEGRSESAGRAGKRQSTTGFERYSALYTARGKSGRPVSGGMYWPDQIH